MNLDPDAQGALLRAAKIRYDTLSQSFELASRNNHCFPDDFQAGRVAGRILRELGHLERAIVELERTLKECS